MDALLITLGSLGFGAILISAYVFTVAARNYVSNDQRINRSRKEPNQPFQLTLRNSTDRRKGQAVSFPLTVNGILVPLDRRLLPDRRIAA